MQNAGHKKIGEELLARFVCCAKTLESDIYESLKEAEDAKVKSVLAKSLCD